MRGVHNFVRRLCVDEEVEDFHQRNWLHGFGDRTLDVERGGRNMGFIGEGLYACGGIWDSAFSYSNGEYADIPANGALITLRDFDWWKREGDYLINCMIELAVTLLPQPLSPTMPRVWPFASAKSTPFTACTTPLSVKKCVFRLRTSKIGSAPLLPFIVLNQSLMLSSAGDSPSRPYKA